jgi:hypothetical protein
MTVADLPLLNSAKISLNSLYLKRSAVNSCFADSMNRSVLASGVMSQEGSAGDLGKNISEISPKYLKYCFYVLEYFSLVGDSCCCPWIYLGEMTSRSGRTESLQLKRFWWALLIWHHRWKQNERCNGGRRNSLARKLGDPPVIPCAIQPPEDPHHPRSIVSYYQPRRGTGSRARLQWGITKVGQAVPVSRLLILEAASAAKLVTS